MLAQYTRSRHSIHDRHVQVHDDYIRNLHRGGLHGFASVRRDIHTMAL